MTTRTPNKHRLDQLAHRVGVRPLVEGMHYEPESGGMCIIGHMADMAGVMYEEVQEYQCRYKEGKGFTEEYAQVPFRDASGIIKNERYDRISDHICDHFGVTRDNLSALQYTNDTGPYYSRVFKLTRLIRDIQNGFKVELPK